MGHAEEVRKALNNPKPIRQNVGGHSFPSIGLRAEDQAAFLETAVADLAVAISFIAGRLDELEGRQGS